MENNKAAEAASNPAGGTTAGQTMNGNGGSNPDPSTIPNPKLGMAPLSSELAVAAASNNIPTETHQLLDPPPSDLLRPADPQNTPTIPPTADLPRPDPVAVDPPQVPTIPVPPEPEQVPQANDPTPSFSDPTALPPDPTPVLDPAEQPNPPDPTSQSDPLPTDVDSRPPLTSNAPE